MKKILKKIRKKHLYLVGGFLFLFLISFLFVSPVEANWITKFFGWIFAAIVYILGLFLMLLIKVLVYIAQVNNFIHISAVTTGWSMVRDIANMFFIVILLIIAFATILQIEKYNYKKWLPKLILMAILINYSKMICGVLIDIAQVIMLSFVNSFKTIGGTNITTMLGIQKWHQINEASGGTVGEWEVMGAYFLAVVYVMISIVVIGTMILVLVMRIVMIWIYVILSPLAFLLSSFPGGQSYASKWWTQFTQNLVVGPVLAFFIWLSFTIVTTGSPVHQILGQESGLDYQYSEGTGKQASDEQQGFGSGDLMIQFIVSIGLLIGGLKVSQEIGGAAGSIAGKGMARINKMSVGAQNLAKKGAIGTGKFVGRETLGRVSNLASKAPEGSKIKAMGDIGKAWRADIKTSRKKAKVEKREKFLKSMGMGESAGDIISSKLKETGLNKRFETMYKATDKMGKDPKRIKKWEKHLEQPENIQAFNASDVYTLGSGVNKGNTKAMLNNPELLRNFENWLKGDGEYAQNGRLETLAYTGDAKDLAKAKALKSAIEEAKTEDIKGFENGDSLKAHLDNMNLDVAIPTQTTRPTQTTTPGAGGIQYNRNISDKPNNDLADNVVSSNVNKGKLFTSSFASGNKEIMGVSFDSLKEDGIDIDVNADGANLNKERMGDNLKPIVDSLINQINQAKINIDKEIKSVESLRADDASANLGSGYIKKLELEKENLDKAKTRLKGGDFENVHLVNTSSPKYGREMSLRNAYHEELHGAGLEDEYVTKTIENSLMENKLYGRNSETGNRHASEIGSMASKLEKEGKNDQEIVNIVQQEIKDRSKKEASSRADRVHKLEKGELETESEATDSYKKSSTTDVGKEEKVTTSASLDISQLESVISEFSSKLREDLSVLDKKGGNSPLVISQGVPSLKFDQAGLLRQVNKAVTGGNAAVIKSINNYNKASQSTTKKIILKELKDTLNN